MMITASICKRFHQHGDINFIAAEEWRLISDGERIFLRRVK